MGNPFRTDCEQAENINMSSEVQIVPMNNLPQESDSRSLMRLVEQAMSTPDFDVTKLQALLEVKERWEKGEARKAFIVAMNAFKANPPEVLKKASVAFGSGTNKTAYKHATLDTASDAIGNALSRHDISHRWDVQQEGAKIRVTCILTHSQGHSESVTMEAAPDTSGSKNAIQAVGSAVSYLQRYTLFTASGIAPKNVDDDGRGGIGVHEMDERVKADFHAAIESLTDLKSAEALWASISSECTKSGDVQAYDALKAAMAAKRKALKQQESRA